MAVDADPLRGFTLGELLDGDLGLELVTGGEHARDRRVAGAHSIEIDHAAAWLGRDWVMLTTGGRLRHSADAQRRLVGELDEIGAAALGFGVGMGFKRVPSALLREARTRDLPVFSVPLRTPFRDVVSAVNGSLLSSEVRAMQRLSSLQLYLMDALEEDDPRAAIIDRLGRVRRRDRHPFRGGWQRDRRERTGARRGDLARDHGSARRTRAVRARRPRDRRDPTGPGRE